MALGVDLQEPARRVREFARDFGAEYPIVIDLDADVAAQYRLLGLPSTYFIDEQSILRAQRVSLVTDEIIEEKLRDAGFERVESLP